MHHRSIKKATSVESTWALNLSLTLFISNRRRCQVVKIFSAHTTHELSWRLRLSARFDLHSLLWVRCSGVGPETFATSEAAWQLIVEATHGMVGKLLGVLVVAWVRMSPWNATLGSAYHGRISSHGCIACYTWHHTGHYLKVQYTASGAPRAVRDPRNPA